MEILNDLEKVRFNLEVSIGEIENILITAKDFKKSALSCIKKAEKIESVEEFEAKVFKDCVETFVLPVLTSIVESYVEYTIISYCFGLMSF